MKKTNQAGGEPSNLRSQKHAVSPQIQEYAGDIMGGDFWVKIGFNRTELAALHVLATRFSRSVPRGSLKASYYFRNSYKPTVGSAARRVLLSALAHWDKLQALDQADEEYATNEGFLDSDDYIRGLIRALFRLSPAAVYRRDGRSNKHRAS